MSATKKKPARRRPAAAVPPGLYALALAGSEHGIARGWLSGQVEEAQQHADRWLARLDDDEQARHSLAGLVGDRALDENPGMASSDEICELVIDVAQEAFLIGMAFTYRALTSKGGAS